VNNVVLTTEMFRPSQIRYAEELGRLLAEKELHFIVYCSIAMYLPLILRFSMHGIRGKAGTDLGLNSTSITSPSVRPWMLKT